MTIQVSLRDLWNRRISSTMRRNSTPKTKSLRAARGGTRKSSQRGGMERSPPMLSANLTQSHRFRFIASSNIAAVTIQSADLIRVAGMMAVSTSQLNPINQVVRLKRVEIWAPTATSNVASTASVEWPGAGFNPSREFSDTSINVSEPAHVVAKPPIDALAQFWQAAGQAMFILTCPAGSVVDVTLQFIQLDGTASASSIAVTGATQGAIYYGYLDGDTTHLLTPVSLSSIF